LFPVYVGAFLHQEHWGYREHRGFF